MKFPGKGVIWRGDCLEVMPRIPDHSVHLVCADLPYGTTAQDWDTVINFEMLWEELKRIITQNGVLVFTATGMFAAKLALSNPDWFKYDLVWQKTKASGFTNVRVHPLRTHEWVLVFSPGSCANRARNPMTYNPQGTRRVNRVVSGANKDGKGSHGLERKSHLKSRVQELTDYPKSVITIRSQSKTEHGTQKPVALMEYLIRTYSNPGETVLDPTIGSGTTAIAAVNSGRKFIGIEQDQDIYELACRRVERRLQRADFGITQ